MGRAPCCDKNGLKKGPWTAEEDQKLMDYIQEHGQGNWRTLPKNAGLSRCGKSCRLRWTNYLRPDIKRGRFSFEEEETVIQLHSLLGNKWSAIAARLPGRTDNEIKNYWNTHIRKRLLRMGIDPVTHSPRLDLLDLSSILSRPTMYNTSHTIESIMNSELLRIATNLLSARRDDNPNSNYLMQDSLQEEELSNPQIQTQFQSFPTTQQEALILSDPHIMQASETYMSQALPTCQIQSNVNTNDASFVPIQNFTNYGLDQSINLDGLSSSLVYPNINNFSSVMSAPTSCSTPMNSTTPTYLNSSTDEDGVSYCSTDMLNFQIPDLSELNDFM